MSPVVVCCLNVICHGHQHDGADSIFVEESCGSILDGVAIGL